MQLQVTAGTAGDRADDYDSVARLRPETAPVDGIVIVNEIKELLSEAAESAEVLRERHDPEKLPPTFPVLTASAVIGIGRNQTYRMVKDGTYPVRILEINGRYKVSRYDLLVYLGARRVAS